MGIELTGSFDEELVNPRLNLQPLFHLDGIMAPGDVQDTSAAPSAPSQAQLQPPPEKPSDISRRTRIVISFWLLVLCLGVPIWWKTTTIYRANLPLDDMMQWAEGKVRYRLRLRLLVC
jgi:hypothetical protein